MNKTSRAGSSDEDVMGLFQLGCEKFGPIPIPRGCIGINREVKSRGQLAIYNWKMAVKTVLRDTLQML